MRAAVVMVTWNSAEHIARALDGLGAQTLEPARTVVVDNASHDGTVELVRTRYPRVELIENRDNAGFARGNNIGVEAVADCDAVALLNPDAFPEPGWLEALVRAAESEPGAAFFGSRMMRVHDPEEIDGTGDLYHASGLALRRHHGLRIGDAPAAALEPGQTFSACAGAALYRRDAFVATGGFDEEFGSYLEDTDLAFRLRLAGYSGRYVPDSVVHHVGSSAAGVEGEYTVYHAHRNLVWTWVKNMPAPLVALYLPQHLLLNATTVVWYALRRRGGAILRAKRDAIRDLPRVLRQRRRIQRARRIGAREVRAALSTGLDEVTDVRRRMRLTRAGAR